MSDTVIEQARKVIRDKPYLAWYTKNYDNLSPQSILESVLNTGDWEDFLTISQIFGIKQTARIFADIKNKKRVNLRPQTINYFTKYFHIHA